MPALTCLHEFIHLGQCSKLHLSAIHLATASCYIPIPLFEPPTFLNAEKKQVMKSIVAKHEVDSAPIPVIGTEPALDSAIRELASKELDSSEIEGGDKLSCIAVSAYYKAESRGYEPGHEMQDWLDAEAEIMKKSRGEKIK